MHNVRQTFKILSKNRIYMQPNVRSVVKIIKKRIKNNAALELLNYYTVSQSRIYVFK